MVGPPPEEFETWRHLETVVLQRCDGTARVMLNRPESLNAWTPQLGDDLREALDACSDADVRAVLITGAGRGFSSGADLKFDSPLTASGKLEGHYNAALSAVRGLEKPVIAAVNGVAAGIGCSLALCCDLVMMGQGSSFMLAFARVGLVPDGGASSLVASRAGAGRAMEMAMLGEKVTAPTALSWGLAQWVVPDEALTATSMDLARRLAQGPTRAYATIKSSINGFAIPNLDRQLVVDAREQDIAEATEDHHEGVQAFLERRQPRFTGR